MASKARTLGSAVSVGGVIQRDGAIVSYDTVNDLPLSGNNIGDTAYVEGFSRVYMWTGFGWFSIALVNQNPTFDSSGLPDSSYSWGLSDADDSGNFPSINIQLSATDPEGIPIQYDAVLSDSANYFLTVSNDSSLFTVTPKNISEIELYDSNGGVVSVTFRASDGINLATALSEFTIDLAKTWFVNYGVETYVYSASTGTTVFRFKPDGTKMYTVPYYGGSVNQYSLSTPWDLSTTTYDSISVNLDSITTGDFRYTKELRFKPDGTKLYASQQGGGMAQFTLTTPWDITSATLDVEKTFGFYEGGREHTCVFFRDDGSQIFIFGIYYNRVWTYDLGTPWDITSWSISGTAVSLTPETSPRDMFIKPDGTKVYVIGAAKDGITQYSLTTPWDFDTLILDNILFGPISGQESLFWKSDGTKFYASNGPSSGNGTIWEYSL